MPVIKQEYIIRAPIEKVWRCLVDPEEIDKWGGGPAQIDDRVGTDFEFWGGDITGQNIEVEAPRKLVQEWRQGDWPRASIVTFELSSLDGQTQVDLTQADHPESEDKELRIGWSAYYLGAIQKYLEGEQ